MLQDCFRIVVRKKGTALEPVVNAFLTNEKSTFSEGFIAQAADFISGIQMYADVYEHGSKGEVILSADHKRLQGVVVQNPVIDPFVGSPLNVNILVLLGIHGHGG